MITTIQNRLITPTPFTNTRQRINNSQTNLLSLLRLIDSDIFNVSDESQVAQEFPLDENTTSPDDTVGLFVNDDDEEVGVCAGA